jgi:5-methylcytosine-specific restriction endonuclease McrA
MAASPKARQMAAIIKRDEPDGVWRCRYCRTLVMPLVDPLVWNGLPYPERDHVIPRSRGGAGTMANSAVACQSCNVRKGARLLSELPSQWWTGVRA